LVPSVPGWFKTDPQAPPRSAGPGTVALISAAARPVRAKAENLFGRSRRDLPHQQLALSGGRPTDDASTFAVSCRTFSIETFSIKDVSMKHVSIHAFPIKAFPIKGHLEKSTRHLIPA